MRLLLRNCRTSFFLLPKTPIPPSPPFHTASLFLPEIGVRIVIILLLRGIPPPPNKVCRLATTHHLRFIRIQSTDPSPHLKSFIHISSGGVFLILFFGCSLAYKDLLKFYKYSTYTLANTAI